MALIQYNKLLLGDDPMIPMISMKFIQNVMKVVLILFSLNVEQVGGDGRFMRIDVPDSSRGLLLEVDEFNNLIVYPYDPASGVIYSCK